MLLALVEQVGQSRLRKKWRAQKEHRTLAGKKI